MFVVCRHLRSSRARRHEKRSDDRGCRLSLSSFPSLWSYVRSVSEANFHFLSISHERQIPRHLEDRICQWEMVLGLEAKEKENGNSSNAHAFDPLVSVVSRRGLEAERQLTTPAGLRLRWLCQGTGPLAVVVSFSSNASEKPPHNHQPKAKNETSQGPQSQGWDWHTFPFSFETCAGPGTVSFFPTSSSL